MASPAATSRSPLSMVEREGVLRHHRPITAAAPAPMANSTSLGMTSRAVPRFGASGLPVAAGRGRGPGSAAARRGAAIAGLPEGVRRAGRAIPAAPLAGDRTGARAGTPAGAAPAAGWSLARRPANRRLLAAGRLDTGRSGNPLG